MGLVWKSSGHCSETSMIRGRHGNKMEKIIFICSKEKLIFGLVETEQRKYGDNFEQLLSEFWKSMRLVNRISCFYIDLYINIETRELKGHQLGALPLQWLHSGTSVGGIRWQWLSASPQMNLAVVILPSTGWKLLSQRHCRFSSSQTGQKPLPSPSLPCPPCGGPGSVQLLAQCELQVCKVVHKL